MKQTFNIPVAEGRKVALATPFYNVTGFSPYISSLVQTVYALARHSDLEFDFWDLSGDSYIDQARNSLAYQLLVSDFTDLFFIDSDEHWTFDSFLRILNSPYDMVGAGYPCKNNWDFYGCVLNYDENLKPIVDKESGLVSARIVPAGFMRINRSVFERLIPKVGRYPAKNGHTYHYDFFGRIPPLGEDGSFNLRCEQAGIKRWVEPNATISHYGIEGHEGNYKKKLFPVLKPVAKEKRHVEGTCVIRMGGIGDLIMVTSSLKKLKEKNPDTPLYMATLKKNMFLFKDFPVLDGCISIEDDLDNLKFDKKIDLRYSAEAPEIIKGGKTTWKDYAAKNRSDLFDKKCGVSKQGKSFYIASADKDNDYICQMLKNAKHPIIGLNCCIESAARDIPPKTIEPLCKLLLQNLGVQVVLFGISTIWNQSNKMIEMDGVINLIDKITSIEMISLISMLDLLIAPDTGSVHIAGALGKKALALFGNIDPKTRISQYSTVTALTSPVKADCIPCHDLHNCVVDQSAGSMCMRGFTPEFICEEAQEVLDA